MHALLADRKIKNRNFTLLFGVFVASFAFHFAFLPAKIINNCFLDSSILAVNDELSKKNSTEAMKQLHRDHHRDPVIPLRELVQSDKADSKNCALSNGGNNDTGSADLILVKDKWLDPKLLFQGGRTIPRLIHITSKSRCNAKVIAKNIDTWRYHLEDHSLVLHDDEAMDRLLYRDWPEFPGLAQILKCLPERSGAVLADVWRILVLWEYGGIYTDMDSSPVPVKFNKTTITNDDDAFFVIDSFFGTPSQWFMAASPRHPMMYLTMKRIMLNVMSLADVGILPVVYTTGPVVVGQGFEAFIGGSESSRPWSAGRYKAAPSIGTKHSVTLTGSLRNENEYIIRVIPKLKDNMVKHKFYQETGMNHLVTMHLKSQEKHTSCFARLYQVEEFKMLAPELTTFNYQGKKNSMAKMSW